MNFRLLTVVVTVVSLPFQREALTPVLVALFLASCASFFPLWYWERVSRVLMRHPSILGVDLVLGMSILTVAGPQSAFFFYTLSVALLAGVLYRWTGAAVFSILLVATYWTALELRQPVVGADPGFQVLVGMPLLYPIFGAAGAAVRRFLERVSRTESALAEADTASAIDRERARLARDMHDSVAKTLHGVSLAAAALPGWIRKDPSRAEREAAALSSAARQAAAEARGAIHDLRIDTLEEPVDRTVEAYARAWSARTRMPAELVVDEVPEPSPEPRWELLCILKEALTNVERHSRAGGVRVALSATGGSLHLDVADDGVGFEVPPDPEAQLAVDHFGLRGMVERARRAGGSLDVVSTPGVGTRVSVSLPLEAAAVEAREA